MPSTPARHRVADLRLRSAIVDRGSRIYWPGPTGPPRALLTLFEVGPSNRSIDLDALCRTLSAAGDFVVLAVRYDLLPEQRAAVERDALRTLEWAAEHAADLSADPDRLLIGGRGAGSAVATAVRKLAHEQGWPPILRQLMIPTL
ncbi:alpha/beta hydrolase fold domain-containing protein [Nocardia sp. NPDC056000]|uniref:alpha/beta hydrolase fold domain-containing protein n=1 Tax=Nocardia sp. NPDC056000 TaxID=3345674 RepID=UPI0035D9243C